MLIPDADRARHRPNMSSGAVIFEMDVTVTHDRQACQVSEDVLAVHS